MAVIDNSLLYDMISDMMKEQRTVLLKGFANALVGAGSTRMWMDEAFQFPVKNTHRPEFVFHNSSFPSADISIFKEERARDPRNPNPNAGVMSVFYIKHGDRRVGQEHVSLAIAKTFARQMHQRLVDALLKNMRETNPNYGTF